MTKSELKSIIKECILEENSLVSENNISVNEDTELILSEDYFDWLYESAISEALEFDSILESSDIVLEGINIIDSIKNFIAKIVEWFKNKVIPFFKQVPDKIRKILYITGKDKIIHYDEKTLPFIIINNHMHDYFNDMSKTLDDINSYIKRGDIFDSSKDLSLLDKLKQNPIMKYKDGIKGLSSQSEFESSLDYLENNKVIVIANVLIDGESRNKVVTSILKRYNNTTESIKSIEDNLNKITKILTNIRNIVSSEAFKNNLNENSEALDKLNSIRYAIVNCQATVTFYMHLVRFTLSKLSENLEIINKN